MYKLLPIIASLATLSRAASISCGAPLSNGTLWYSNATSPSFIGQIGVTEAHGNAEFLAKYPSNNVVAHTVQVLPCNSTYLNATIPALGSTADIPVILQFSDDLENCLSLESQGAHDVYITKQTCQYDENDAQNVQFWTRDAELGLLFPTWANESSERWNIQFNQYATYEVIANPPNCFAGQTCQDGEHYSMIIKEDS